MFVLEVLKPPSRILIFGFQWRAHFCFVAMFSSACLTGAGLRLCAAKRPSKCRRLTIVRKAVEDWAPAVEEEAPVADTRQGGLQCEVCCAVFRHKKQLTRHMASKHLFGVQLFSCTICGGVFKRKDSLQKHERKVHDEGALSVGTSTYKSCAEVEGVW